MSDGAFGKTREEALQAVVDGGPDYPAIKHGPVDGEPLCQHCEVFGNQVCPLHRPRPPRSQASGLYKPISESFITA